MMKSDEVPLDPAFAAVLLHVLPRGLVRIRHFGLFANRKRSTTLARCRLVIGIAIATDPPVTAELRCPICTFSGKALRHPYYRELQAAPFNSHTPSITASARGSSFQTIQSKLPKHSTRNPSSAPRQFRLETNDFRD